MNDLEKTTEEIIESMDQSSKEFTLLVGIDNFLTTLHKKFNLTEVHDTIIDGELTFFLTKQSEYTACISTVKEHLSIDLEKDVIEKIVSEIEIYLKEVLSIITDTKTKELQTAPSNLSPIEAIAIIKDRLTNGSAIASTKRDYSADPTLSTTTPTPPLPPKSDLGATVSQGIKSIDPYRELPEK